MDSRLIEAVRTRYEAVNGSFAMTPEDDAYVAEWYVSLEELAEGCGYDVDDLRRAMLANRLPLPSYLRSDGTQMVAKDLLELAERAGGLDRLPAWFGAQWDTPDEAVEQWDAYLSGQYVCLRSVTPESMKRKGQLVARIETLLRVPDEASDDWRAQLQEAVDELDTLEPPFAPYDRRRFGGPITRDRLIDDVRARYPALAGR